MGFNEGAPVPVPSSPASPQISLGSHTNSTVAGMQIYFTKDFLILF